MSLPNIPSYPMPTKGEFPKNRVEWELDPNRAALLIHDMQTYFLDAYEQGVLVETLIRHIKQLKQLCRTMGIPVYYTGQPGGQVIEDRQLLQDFWGSGIPADPMKEAIVEALAPEEGDVHLTKWRYSAFQRSDLLERMKKQGRNQLLITGVYAHIGCQTTAVDAFMYDIQPFFVGDALADFSLEYHASALRYVASRCGRALTTNECLEQLEAATSRKEVIRRAVAEVLEVNPNMIADDDNLLDLGLDSIRIMALVEKWKQQGMVIAFMDLAEAPSVNSWLELMEREEVATVNPDYM